MQALKIIAVFCTIGLAFGGLLAHDGIKSAAPVGVKGHDGRATKYVLDDQTGDLKVLPVAQAQSVPSSVWQAPSADVSPVQVDKIQNNQYVPVINVQPGRKIEWFSVSEPKKQFAPDIIEQRKEEPVLVSSYEPITGGPVGSEAYDPYKDILPDVLTGKRRLSEEDGPLVSGLPESGSAPSLPEGVRVVPVQSVDGPGGRLPVRSYVYDNKGIPQHVYTEDSFPSVITIKGRQYLVVPTKASGSKVQSGYYSPSVPYSSVPISWASYTGNVNRIVPVNQGSYGSYVYQSGPSGQVGLPQGIVSSPGQQQVYGQRQVYTLVPASQTLTGPSIQLSGLNVQHGLVHQQQALPAQSGLGLVSSGLPTTSYERPSSAIPTSLQPDYQPLLQTQFAQRIPYSSPYYTNQQPYYYSPPSQIPTQTIKPQVPITKPNWAWIQAPQYVNSEGLRQGSWVLKGVHKSKGLAEASVSGPASASGYWDPKNGLGTYYRGISEDPKKVSSPEIKPTADKSSWFVYSPVQAAPWTYGVSQFGYGLGQPGYSAGPAVSPIIPQYGAQWDGAEAGKGVSYGQWSSAAPSDDQWGVKPFQQGGYAVTGQGVGYAPTHVKQTEKVEPVPAVVQGSVSAASVPNQASAGIGGVHYAFQIDHGSGGKFTVQQAPQEIARKS